MATANFWNSGFLSKTYAIFDDEIEFFELGLNDWVETKRDVINNRNYPVINSWEKDIEIRLISGEEDVEFSFENVEYNLNFTLSLVAGYYEGASFHLSIFLEDGSGAYLNWEEMSFSDLIEWLKHDADVEEDEAEELASILERKINDIISETISELEKYLDEITTPLCKVAQFSNGEAIYSAC